MAKTSKRKAPPSRIKYENSHPTVSCRVSKEIYDMLTDSKKVDGKSFADILKIGLGIVEKGDKKLDEQKKLSWGEGFKKGYAEAEFCYKVTYPCSKCGRTIEVKSREEKLAIQKFIKERRWSHYKCPEKQN